MGTAKGRIRKVRKRAEIEASDLSVLRDFSNTTLTWTQIARRNNLSDDNMFSSCERLIKQGRLVKVSHGAYRPVGSIPRPDPAPKPLPVEPQSAPPAVAPPPTAMALEKIAEEILDKFAKLKPLFCALMHQSIYDDIESSLIRLVDNIDAAKALMLESPEDVEHYRKMVEIWSRAEKRSAAAKRH